MIERITAWECIGCGRVMAERPCVGVCQDRVVKYVRAEDFEQATASTSEMRALLTQLAGTTPRNGDWESSYRAFQQRARELLKRAATPEQPPVPRVQPLPP